MGRIWREAVEAYEGDAVQRVPWWVCQVIGGLRDEVTWEGVQVDGEERHEGHVADEAVGAYVGGA